MVAGRMFDVSEATFAFSINSTCCRRHQTSFPMLSKPSNILSDATLQFRNGLRRVTSSQQSDKPRPRGKENYPSTPSPIMPSTSPSPDQWDPVDGMIIIKVSVPSTDDIWRFKIPQNTSLRAFRAKVELKVGFAVTFVDGTTPQSRRVASEEAFKRWITGRVKNGRNNPITALKKQQSYLAYPSTPTSPLSPPMSSAPLSPASPPSPLQTFAQLQSSG